MKLHLQTKCVFLGIGVLIIIMAVLRDHAIVSVIGGVITGIVFGSEEIKESGSNGN